MFKLLLVLNGQKIFKTFLLFILILSIKRFYFILFNLFFWKALLFLNLIWVLPQIFKIELPYKRRFWLILVDRLFEIPQKLDLTFKSLLIFPSFLHIWRLLISLKQGPLVRNLFHNFSRRPVRIRFFQPLSLFLAVENVRWKGLFRSNSTWRVLHRFYVRHFHVRFHGRFITTWGHQRTILVFYWWLCFKLNSTLLVGFDWRFVHWDIISWAAFLRLIISHLVEHVNEFVHFFLVPFQILLSQLPILFQASFCLLLPDATNDFHNVQRSYLRLFFCYTGSSLQNKERKLDLNKKKTKVFFWDLPLERRTCTRWGVFWESYTEECRLQSCPILSVQKQIYPCPAWLPPCISAFIVWSIFATLWRSSWRLRWRGSPDISPKFEFAVRSRKVHKRSEAF